MKTFSINRFFLTLRWLLSVSRKTLTATALGGAAGFFLFEMVAIYYNRDTDPRYVIQFISSIATFILIAFALVSVSASFSIHTHLGDKRQRTSLLMLPATNGEKFLAVAVLTTFILPLLCAASILVGDLLRMAFEYAMQPLGLHETLTIVHQLSDDEVQVFHWWSPMLPTIIENLKPNFTYPSIYRYATSYIVMQVVFLAVSFAWIHSLFLLCGTLLRRYAFVVSCIVLVACFMLVTWTTNEYDLPIFRSEWYGDGYVSQEVGAFAYVLTALLAILAIANYCVAYRAFKRFQITTNKWTNYDILSR